MPGLDWRGVLRASLEKISDAYDRIRSYDLLGFSEVPSGPLELIWHELGRVKERGGRKSASGRYYVISVCKPLMLLWGQTLAFDSRVRASVPRGYGVPQRQRWRFAEWSRVMRAFQGGLRRSPELVSFLKGMSLEKYGSDASVPYGRFLDMYYF